MAFKLNISEKGKAWKLESEDEVLVGKSLGDKFDGKEISQDLAGYELEITGASDIAGFPHKGDVEGPELKRVLFTELGWGMHKRPRREGKKKVQTPKGLRLRKTVRGKQLSEKTVQINLTVVKAGKKSLAEIFPDQNKMPEPAQESAQTEVAPAPSQQAQETKEEKMEETKEKIQEEIKEEIKEEVEKAIPTSPETKTEEEKEEAAEEVAEEVAEELEEVIEEIAQDESAEEDEEEKKE